MLSQNRSAEQINRFKKQFLQMDMPDVMDLLDTDHLCEMIEEAVKEIPHKLRERIWTPVVTLFAFVKQVLVNGRCSDAVRSVQAEQIRQDWSLVRATPQPTVRHAGNCRKACCVI